MPELHTERSSEQGCAGRPRVACERESTRRSAKRGESGRWSCQARPRSAQGGGRRRTRARRARGAARGELWALLHENTHRLSGFTSSPHIHCFVPPGVCGMCGWWGEAGGEGRPSVCLLLPSDPGGAEREFPTWPVFLAAIIVERTQRAGRVAQHGGRQHTCAGPPSQDLSLLYCRGAANNTRRYAWAAPALPQLTRAENAARGRRRRAARGATRGRAPESPGTPPLPPTDDTLALKA